MKKESKPKIEKKSKPKTENKKPIIHPEMKVVKIPARQRAYSEKKTKLAVKARQTKWAPVWIVIKKYGTGKRIHPSATTKYRRSWRRTKLHIKPRRIRKWHLG